VEFEVCAAADTFPYRFIIEAAVAALALLDCIWFSAAVAAALGKFDVALAAPPPAGAAVWALATGAAVLVAGTKPDNVELMEIS
jgi:hypothetical protein